MTRDERSTSRSYRVGIVVPALTESGGVAAAARFLCEMIDQCSWLDYRLFSLPTSARDPTSVRLAAPRSWLRGPDVNEGIWLGRTYEKVGSVISELEFQRYRPRSPLTERLRECDLIQVVAGSPAWALVARKADRPVVLQVATMAAIEREERFRMDTGILTAWRRLMTRITSWMDRRGIQVSDNVLVLNSWMKAEVQTWTDPDRVMLAPPGVDTEFFHPPSSPNLDSGPILSVGRFDDRRKNVRLLFRAYAKVCRADDYVPPLVLVGISGPRDGDWRLAADLGIQNRVRFYEDVSREELADHYRRASLFVLPSSEEGLGIVLLEAMASGLPVVSTATEGAKEAVKDGETGILTPVGDACALSKAIARLAANPATARKMGREGRVRAEERYSKKAAGRRFLAGYRKLLGPNLSHKG